MHEKALFCKGFGARDPRDAGREGVAGFSAFLYAPYAAARA